MSSAPPTIGLRPAVVPGGTVPTTRGATTAAAALARGVDSRRAVVIAAVLATGLFVAMAAELPTLLLVIGVLAVGAAVVHPVIGIALLAMMMPLREPEIFGPAWFVVTLACATLGGCIFRLPVDRPFLAPSAGYLLLLGYLLYSMVTLPSQVSGFAPEPTESAIYQFVQVAGGLIVFTAGYLVFERVDAIPILVAGTVAAAVAAVLGIVFLAWGSDDVPFRGVFSPLIWVARAVGPFGNSNYFGLFLGLTTVLAVGLLGVVDRAARVVLLAVIAILALALLLTFSRGSVLALGAGLVTLAFVRSKALGLAVIGGAVLIVAIAYPLFIDARFDLTLSPRTDPDVSLSASDASRLAAFEAGFDIFAQAPLFGIGFGQYQTASAELLLGAETTYPHNAGVKVLAEQGLVGVALALTIVVLFVRAIIRSRHPLRGTAIAAMVTYAVGSVLSEPFWSIQTSGVTWLLFAAVLAPRLTRADDRSAVTRAQAEATG